jgi:hypothetical protein
MSRLLLAALAMTTALSASADAQMPMTPGPGGIAIAPGAPATGHTPGGVGPGGVEVPPGPAARGVPMYRIGPGGTALPPAPDPTPGADRPTVRLDPGRAEGDPGIRRYRSLQLTISSRDAGPAKAPSPDAKINSIDELFAALRACWAPPARGQGRESLQMTVRFSFKRGGEIVAPPFVTYTTPGTEAATKQVYRQAIIAALDRCTPLPLSKAFTAEIVGRPLSVRYVDDRGVGATQRTQ